MKEALLSFNRRLGECAVKYKNMIDQYFAKRNCWDQVKKFSNDYEFIFTSLQKYPCVAKIAPSSRSYFKLWEILKEYDGIGLLRGEGEGRGSIKTAHVAEGPGGFMECILDWTAKHAPDTPTEAHGITLISRDRMVPNWKISKNRMAKGNVTLHYGADGTGDIYKLSNIEHFVENVGEGSCDLITADGGFDIHGNFNHQENIIERLLISEMYTAMRVCKPGGSFVLKVFDLFEESTIQLFWILKLAFREVHLLKPLSSRPANSEKYVVACDYRGHPESMQMLERYIVNNGEVPFQLDIPSDFILELSSYNKQYCFRQMYYICKTIAFIEIIYNQKQKEFLDNIIYKQYKLCKEWCLWHDIPYQSNTELENKTV